MHVSLSSVFPQVGVAGHTNNVYYCKVTVQHPLSRRDDTILARQVLPGLRRHETPSPSGTAEWFAMKDKAGWIGRLSETITFVVTAFPAVPAGLKSCSPSGTGEPNCYIAKAIATIVIIFHFPNTNHP